MDQSPYLSKDKQHLDVLGIYQYLSQDSYWARGRSLAQVKQSIEHSICFGLYLSQQDHNIQQVAFARVITDQVSFAYILDLFVFEGYRGRGYGKQLVAAILEDQALSSVNWLLRTQDAHGLYQPYGFTPLEQSGDYLKRSST